MIREISHELLGDKYFEIDHNSGLKILVMPKSGYKSTCAFFGTNFGSVDFQLNAIPGGESTPLPNGTAHFLEHKLFECEEVNAFELFQQTGASANAFTSFDKTCYYFRCSANLERSLEILLDFVKSPFFTEQTVLKEQGIIRQEIGMYRDNPEWQVLFELLGAMYQNNPVKQDIAGTAESISRITAQLLYDCCKSYYNLSNMVLAVVGDTTPQQVVSVADRTLKKEAPIPLERATFSEPEIPCVSYTEKSMNVANRLFAIGFKETSEKYADAATRATVDVLLEVLAGKTSALYASLLSEGLINGSFSTEHFVGRGFDCEMFSGEAEKPQEVLDRLLKVIADARQNGITEKSFETARRKKYGRAIMSFEDVDIVARDMTYAYFGGEGLFSYVNALAALTLNDIMAALRERLAEERVCLSVVY